VAAIFGSAGILISKGVSGSWAIALPFLLALIGWRIGTAVAQPRVEFE